MNKIATLIVANCQNLNVRNLLASGIGRFPEFIGYGYGLLLVAVNIALFMTDGNQRKGEGKPVSPKVPETPGQQQQQQPPKTSQKGPVSAVVVHNKRKLGDVVSGYKNQLQILKDENSDLLQVVKDKDESIYKLTEDIEGLRERVLDHRPSSSSSTSDGGVIPRSSLDDNEFLELLDDFVKDPSAGGEEDFPEPSLLEDFKRRFVFEIVLQQKRKLGRAVREKDALKRQLECRQSVMSHQEPREEPQIVSTLERRIETLEQEKKEMGDRLARQIEHQKKTDGEKERLIANLMEKLKRLEKEAMENGGELEEESSSKEAPLDQPTTDSSSSTQESEAAAAAVESIFDPSFRSVGSGERNGPDQILESTLVKTANRTDAVKLHLEERGVASRQPVSVPTLFKQKVEEYEDKIALQYKEDGEWKGITYGVYYQQVNLAAKAFIKLGLKRLHAVCMFGYNHPCWFMGHLAAIFAGGIAAGIYHTNELDACEYIARDTKGSIFVVEGPREVSIMKEVQERLNAKLVIIQYSGEPEDGDVYSWQDLMDIGEKELDKELEERLTQIAINQCCALMYTSGTTGMSKGVMLSHDALTWMSTVCVEYLGIKPGEETLLSYLSLAHIAALILDLYGSLVSGGKVYFADRTITQGMNLVTTLQELQPTFFFTVPRGWEKMAENIQREISSLPWIVQQIVGLARKIATKYSERIQAGSLQKPLGYSLADKLLFQKIRTKLGLQNCQTIMSGASGLSVDVSQFFHSLGILVLETYGLSETSGGHTIGMPNDFMIGASGSVREGFHVKIEDPDDEGRGEILLKGRNIAMGYLNKEEETNAAKDDKGWFHTGDIGMIDAKNYLHITGRRKRLIITSQGYNVAPEPIELKVKGKLPCVSFPVLVGDNKKFLSMLLPMAAEIDPTDGLPLSDLAPTTVAWCRSVGSTANTIEDILEGPDEMVMQAIQKVIDEVNATAYNNQHKIQKWAILPLDFTLAGGELTPTAKVKMDVVLEKYKNIIDEIYDV
ncbi:long-chain-fatty-acid--CoA ligase ACSBG2-like [Macrobrachium nipponense]|uniref:long-chain-fatty-acid--CoA ligase ACSBG2-like n=1 Tax=Macrobrachium nipponense TaxID=159736 RepID=UPI0030C8B4D9